jgi:drug/metabolite transporter (DMT)-like permease
MKPVSIIGIVVILLGVAGFFIGGVSVKDQETKAQIGDLKITAETQKNYPIPPWAAGLVVLAGVGIAVYGFVNKR